MPLDIFDCLNNTDDLKPIFGEHFVGPDKLTHGEEQRVAVYGVGDSQVEVTCTAMPSKFFGVILPNGDRIGTGSGMDVGKWAEKSAWMISTGELIVEPGSSPDELNEKYEHLLALINKPSKNDGYNLAIYSIDGKLTVLAALPSTNSVNELRAGFTFLIGSNHKDWIEETKEHIVEGMIGYDKK